MEAEQVSMGEALVIGLFLAVAVLVVLSTVCKLLLVVGWVPKARRSRLRRAIEFIARAAGNVRVTSGGRSRSGGPEQKSGGGTSGGGGASGDFS
ncbi:hypothetical protein ABLE93_24610 [Xanthobacter sp. KR7-65]|uniref:hypothetical protein n=1 Tax=Xanthobacter sp. KR7-65 TaxID=3156612 RepID=UPI0032B43C7B